MKGVATDIHDYDREQIIDGITELYQDNADQCGFVTRSEVEGRFAENGIRFRHRDGEIVCAMSFRHLQRGHYTAIYRSAISANGSNEDRKALLHGILRESPHEYALTKVPYDSEENAFWAEVGELQRSVEGRKRQLNVYRVVNDYVNSVLDY